MKETITYKELDEIIDSYKEDRPQKKALLVLKSGCEPYRGKSIPRLKAEKIMSARVSTEQVLAERFADDDDDELFEHFSGSAQYMGNVIRLVFEEIAE